MKKNCFIKDDSTYEKSIDEAIKSVRSIGDVKSLCNSLTDPSSLKKFQKERLIKKLIKFSESYDDLCEIKDYYVEILGYNMTHKQICKIIEKLVYVAKAGHELETVKKYAKKNHLMSRYMKVHLSKDMEEILMKKESTNK